MVEIKRHRLLPVTLALIGFAANAAAQHYLRTDLVSNVPVPNAQTDKNLVNAWGLSRSSSSPWWVSDNGTGMSTLYDGNGNPQSLVVAIPGSPTGTVYNGTQDFQIVPNMPAVFLFASEDGTISGWNPNVDRTHAKVVITSPGAIYKGLAIATVDGKSRLYAADFHNGRIDTFDAQFKKMPRLGGLHHRYAWCEAA